MKVILDPQDWSEPRFEALRRAMGWSQAETLGVLALFWHSTKEACVIEAPRERIKMYLSVPPETADAVFTAMHAIGYLSPVDDSNMWRIDGNDSIVTLIRSRREWGKQGVERRIAAPAKKKKAPASPPSPAKVAAKALSIAAKEANKGCWEAYREAYVAKYRVEPLRDARANSLVAAFVKRIGQDRAPEVIRFFVDHNDAGYVKAMHSLNCAVRDADAIHTQWQRGAAITGQDVRCFEAEQRVRGQLDRVARGQL